MSSSVRSVSEAGVLRPDRLPSFVRLLPPPEVAPLLGHLWIPEWDLPDGVVLPQSILAHPATNLVVQPGGSTVAGASRRASTRRLAGRGWAVGLLLRPAGVEVLGLDPRRFVDAEVPVAEVAAGEPPGGEPHGVAHASGAAPLPGFDAVEAEVARLMTGDDAPPARHAAVLDVVAGWLAGLPAPSEAALQAGTLADLVEDDASILSVHDLAARLGVSTRTVERLVQRYVGTSPGEMIRRRRLQRAAARLREDATLPFALLAAETGYADQAHFSRDFRTVVGSTPSEYRAALG